MNRRLMYGVFPYVHMGNLEVIFFKISFKGVISLRETYKCIRMQKKIHCRITEKRFRGNIAVHYIIQIALSNDSDDDEDDDGEKNLGNRKTRFLRPDSPWFYSFHDLALHNPSSRVLSSRNLRCADRFTDGRGIC